MRNIKYEALLILLLTMYFFIVILPNNIVFKVRISVYGDQSGDGMQVSFSLKLRCLLKILHKYMI